MTWVIWDKLIDKDFRRDLKDATGVDLEPALHFNGTDYIAKTDKLTEEQAEAIRGVYQRSVRFRKMLREVKKPCPTK